ncbi:MAG: M28 family peptidase [Bacteroidales bacterium]|nr:M28 family peptidase [Bacteroidales bacterium]
MKRLLIFLLLCLPAVPAAQGRDREADLRAEVTFLCDSLCAGRGIGTGGSQVASFYLLRQLRNAGLRATVQSFSAGGRVGRNLVAVTPGWYRRYIVIGAWFDGLGTLDGRVYPGADANASGVAALLDLARELPQYCKGDVGIVFVAFDGHHTDLAGANAYLKRYRREYPTMLMVNLDLLGSSLVPVHKDRPDYLIALGGGSRRVALEDANTGPGLDLSYDYYGSSNFTDIFYRKISDQRWFLSSGIPSVMFTSGITENTNKVTDTPETLDYSLLRRRIDLIAAWIRAQL